MGMPNVSPRSTAEAALTAPRRGAPRPKKLRSSIRERERRRESKYKVNYVGVGRNTHRRNQLK